MKSQGGLKTIIAVAAFAVLLVAPSTDTRAMSDTPKVESLSMAAGETRTIDDLNPAVAPSIKVITNPHAIVMNHESPNKLVLVGAEEGNWEISVRRLDGEDVTYNVAVSGIKDWNHPLKPDKYPADGASAARASTPLDTGAVTMSKVEPTPRSSSASVASSGVTEPHPIGHAEEPLSSPAVSSASSPSIQPVSPAPGATRSTPTSAVVPIPTNVGAQTAYGSYRLDPSIAASGDTYSYDGVASSSANKHYLPADGISVMTGMSEVFDFADRISQVSIADSGTADIEVINPFQLNLVGHKPGFTTLTVWTRQGHYEERQVRVSPSGKQQVLLSCMIAELNRTAIENQGINLSAALTKYGISLVSLPGAVGTPYNPNTNLGSTGVAGIGATTTTPPPGVLPPNGQIIPLLLSQGLTYALSAGNSNFQTQALIQFLQQNNLAKILAQPNLLANSGEKAKFLSGGEIPIVIAQALNTSIVFKEFGTKVDFLPTVTGTNDIELLVAPEVSEPDFAHGVQLFGFNVPAFITRRADTVVQLKDNQTLIIAGLILHDKREIIQKVPYLGDIPYLAGFFRNTSWQNTESDLVMSVTPQIVRPLPPGAQVFSPTIAPPLTADALRTQRLTTPDAARPRF